MSVAMQYNGFSMLGEIDEWDEPADRRISFEDVENRHGKLLAGSPVLDARRISVRGKIRADDEATLRARMKLYGQYLGIGGIAALYRYDDTYINARVRTFTKRPKRNNLLTYEFAIEFVCDDPFWYDAALTTDPESPSASPHNWTHTNGGTYLVYPVLTVTASAGTIGCINPRFTNLGLTPNKYAQYTGTVAPGQTLTMDCGKITCKIGSTSYLNNFAGTWLWLAVGNNSMRFTYTGEAPTIQIQYRKRYIED